MILGLHDGHNASVSLINKKNIIFAASEERFKRIKNYRGFPDEALNYLFSNINNDEISYITVGSTFRRRNKLLKLRDFQDKIKKRTVYIYHHLSHSYLYKLSNFKECLIISLDGAGDGLSFLASIGNKDLEIITQSSYIDSIGDFYASITELLGFRSMEHEGKVMSLSSFPTKEEINLKVIDYHKEIWSFRNYLNVVGREATNKLKELLKIKDLDFNTKVKISKFAQRILEDCVLKVVKHLTEEYGIKNVVLTGGVAQNVKLNSKVAEICDSVFVPPFMGDEGLSVGSSLSDKKIDRIKIENTYFGYKIENSKVENLLNKYNLKYKYIEDKEIAEVVGELIINNKIVCLARDKMEFGPRALGNRSIISLPTKENKKKINKLLKRDWFMPFAPTILYEFIDDYLENTFYSPFMTFLFKVKDEKVKEIEGVVHVDNTTRPQTLKRESNPLYYDIIKYVYDTKNIPVVLNTSFNLHGEPIVCKEEDAIKSFLKTKFNYLLLGNYLIEGEK